jgi:membrane-associated phospholipid phosphatase
VYRLEDASEVIREASPPAVTEVFALVTVVGGVPFLVVLLAILYIGWDRETVATVVGYGLVAAAVTIALKAGFALPRPPASVRAAPVDPNSYGFPSGHAVASTVVYGGLLLVRDRVRESRVAVPVVALIALVGLSRVVVGVHYLGDVLAGHAVGLAVLAGLRRGVGERADHACLTAAAVAAVVILLTGVATDSLLVLGASVGGAAAFRRTAG